MTTPYDILGLGCTAIDDLLYVSDYPSADAKVRVRRRERHCGGITATALVAAARLGASCVFAGVLGEDELSRFVLARLEEEGVRTDWVLRRPAARPIASTIIVDETRKTRTILFDLEGTSGAEPDWPDESVIRAARVLFVDHYGIEGMVRAATIARSSRIPVVADLENDEHPQFARLLALADHLILSAEFAARLTGRLDPAEAAKALWSLDRAVVIVTCGAEGCWHISEKAHQPRRQPAFAVEAADTTGCGDVFHGAYAAALARGLDLPQRIRIASAAAALKTRRCGHAGIPDFATVETFLREVGD